MKSFSESFSLRDEVALITGGGTGIGLAIGQAMAAAGARVVLVGRRETELKAAVSQVGAGASYVVQDITRTEDLPAMVERIHREVGPITCLINNAGVHLKKAAVDTSADEFETVLRTHVVGAHALTRAVVPGMMARKHGSVVFTASMASLFGIPMVIAYTAAKTAMVGMVRGYSTEFSAHGIRVNAVAPGWIETDMSRKALDADPARRSKVVGRTPMGRLGEAEDIGWAVVYLCSPAARFVTGVTLPVDGGASIGF